MRNFILAISFRILIWAVLLGGLYRGLGPSLINMHSEILSPLGYVIMVVCYFLAVIAVFDIFQAIAKGAKKKNETIEDEAGLG